MWECKELGGKNEGNKGENFVKEWKWSINVEWDKNKRCAHSGKYSFDTLVWETNKETNLNTDFYFPKYYFILIYWKENMLNINVFLVIVQMSKSSSPYVFFRKDVL